MVVDVPDEEVPALFIVPEAELVPEAEAEEFALLVPAALGSEVLVLELLVVLCVVVPEEARASSELRSMFSPSQFVTIALMIPLLFKVDNALFTAVSKLVLLAETPTL